MPDRTQTRIDAASVAAHLAGAIHFATVTARDGARDTEAFTGLHDYLERTYPRVHDRLGRETIDGRSLLYEWRGRDDARKPIVLMGHLDVVPPVDAAGWAHPPYLGAIDAGFLYGRGSLDDKSAVIAILDAVEQLLADGHQPSRTIHLALGGDEEVGGERGAHQMVEQLRSRDVEPALVLDEGGAIMEGQMPGIPGRVAMVGIAEKGYLSLELRAESAGGHSSTPILPTSIGRLCRAIARLESHQFPAHLGGATLAMLEAIAPHQPWLRRFAMANLWADRPVVIREFLADPKLATLVRTTTAPTIFRAGDKENVLAREATAIVNFQILTGETIASVIRRVNEVIADAAVRVRPAPGSMMSEPSPISDVSGPEFAVVSESIRQTLAAPGSAPPLVVPFLTGPTDSRYWSSSGAKNVYRFTPFPYEADWMSRAHGTDERISVNGLAAGVGFYMQLIQNADRV